MKYVLIFISLFYLVGCEKESNNIDPNSHLSEVEQNNFNYSIIRYTGRLAKKATHETKFDEKFDEEYTALANACDLLFYYPNSKTGEIYFAITKIAPSLKIKKVATVGKLKKDDKGNIVTYEEAFRTWKMEESELKQKTELLFRKYINGEDLSAYYTKNSQPDFYIEFPDDNTYYDKTDKIWISKIELDYKN
ncbi:MAG TPA: hypothetical protein PLL09_07045 [Flavobacterium sp.]|uniref:hypothetical protein n=2 Tax=Flavobacterium TaxID=237 RepID=UPI0025BAFA19|nr:MULTISPECIES: hypothetical protein [unclassified Flavobacterium]HRE77564.1 hypothetical protein [Flavobacterium sp.]